MARKTVRFNKKFAKKALKAAASGALKGGILGPFGAFTGANISRNKVYYSSKRK